MYTKFVIICAHPDHTTTSLAAWMYYDIIKYYGQPIFFWVDYGLEFEI